MEQKLETQKNQIKPDVIANFFRIRQAQSDNLECNKEICSKDIVNIGQKVDRLLDLNLSPASYLFGYLKIIFCACRFSLKKTKTVLIYILFCQYDHESLPGLYLLFLRAALLSICEEVLRKKIVACV